MKLKPRPKVAFVAVNKDTAPLLLELVSKAAIAGPQAHLLAHLYANVETAAKLVVEPPKPPVNET